MHPIDGKSPEVVDPGDTSYLADRFAAVASRRGETFKLSTGPLSVEKIRTTIDLYLDPSGRALVLCVDEKSQIQGRDRTQPLLPMRPGRPDRSTHNYERRGTTSLFAALDVKTGTIISKSMPRRRPEASHGFLNTVARNVPANLDIYVAMNNASSHKTQLIGNQFAERPSRHAHFTTISSPWINPVERLFRLLTEQQIKCGGPRSTKELEAAITAYIDARNANSKPCRWIRAADDILASIGRCCQRPLLVQAQCA